MTSQSRASQYPPTGTTAEDGSENPHEAPGGGLGWIRTSSTQSDDSSPSEPHSASKSVGDGGSSLPETAKPTTVWLLHTGCYENAGVVGVYDSADSAKAAWEADRPNLDPRWKLRGESWDNDHDWDDAASVYPEDVQTFPRSSEPAAQPEILPILDLESRLLVALSARGPMRIGQFVEVALGLADVRDDESHRCIFHMRDEAFVLALEAAVDSAAVGTETTHG